MDDVRNHFPVGLRVMIDPERVRSLGLRSDGHGDVIGYKNHGVLTLVGVKLLDAGTVWVMPRHIGAVYG